MHEYVTKHYSIQHDTHGHLDGDIGVERNLVVTLYLPEMLGSIPKEDRG